MLPFAHVLQELQVISGLVSGCEYRDIVKCLRTIVAQAKLRDPSMVQTLPRAECDKLPHVATIMERMLALPQYRGYQEGNRRWRLQREGHASKKHSDTCGLYKRRIMLTFTLSKEPKATSFEFYSTSNRRTLVATLHLQGTQVKISAAIMKAT
jgi:hypothetical protein